VKISGAFGVHYYALTLADDQPNDYEITENNLEICTITKTPDLFGEYEENNEGSR
jgi:hypothetical protein